MASEYEEPELLEASDHTPIPAIAASLLSFLLALIFVPLAALFGGGGATASTAASSGLEPTTVVGFVLAAFGLFGLGFIAGALGLWRRKTWGWWTLAMLHAFFLLLNGKMMLPLAFIDWEHPRALEAALPHLAIHGVPALTSLVVLLLLSLPGIRMFYGVKERPYERLSRARRVRNVEFGSSSKRRTLARRQDR